MSFKKIIFEVSRGSNLQGNICLLGPAFHYIHSSLNLNGTGVVKYVHFLQDRLFWLYRVIGISNLPSMPRSTALGTHGSSSLPIS